MRGGRHIVATSALLISFAVLPIEARAEMEAEERGYRIQQYDLDVHVLWDEKKIEATNLITLKRQPGIEKIVLDAQSLDIRGVTVNGKRTKFETPGRTLSINIPGSIKEKDLRISINYTARQNPAIHFTGPTSDDPLAPKTFYTIGEPDWASRWFPCDDHPSRAARVNITVTVPQDFLALANGLFVRTPPRVADNKERTFSYRFKKGLAPPFVTITAGDFEVHRLAENGVETTFLYPPRYRQEARDFFSNTAKAIDFLGSYFGRTYPFGKYAAAVVPDYPAGALENTTATTFDLEVIRLGQKNVGVHELGHHWFGDLVRVKSWNDIWLMEGMASYVEAAFARDTVSTDAHKEIMDAFLETYMNESREDPRHLVNYQNRDIDRLFDSHSYEKGAWVYRMLETQLTRGTFQQAIHHFVDEYAGKNASTDDLKRVLERVSQKDLTKFFEQWVYGKGHPKIDWNWEWNTRRKELSIRVKQTQNSSGVPEVFEFPVEFAVQNADGKWIRESFWVNQRDFTARLMGVTSKPRVVLFDPDRTVLMRSVFDSWSNERLQALALQKYDWIAQYEALDNLTKEGRKATLEQSFETIAEVARNKDYYVGARAIAAKNLGHFSMSKAGPVLLELLDAPYAAIRRAAMSSLGRYRSPKFFEPLLKGFERDVCYEAAWALAANDPQRAEAYLMERLRDHTRTAQERMYALYGMGRIRSDTAVATLRNYLFSDSAILRWSAVEAVVDGKVEALTGALSARVNDRHEPMFWIRDRAVRGLATMRAYDSVDRLAEVAWGDPLFSVRNTARIALSRLRTGFRSVSPSVKRKYPGFVKEIHRALADSRQRETKRQASPFVPAGKAAYRHSHRFLRRPSSFRASTPAYTELVAEAGQNQPGSDSFPSRPTVRGVKLAKRMGTEAVQSGTLFFLQKLGSDILISGSKEMWDLARNWKSFEDLRQRLRSEGLPWIQMELNEAASSAAVMGATGFSAESGYRLVTGLRNGLSVTESLARPLERTGLARIVPLWLALVGADMLQSRDGTPWKLGFHAPSMFTLFVAPINVTVAHEATYGAYRSLRTAHRIRKGMQVARVGIRGMQTQALATMNLPELIGTGIVEFTLLAGLEHLERAGYAWLMNRGLQASRAHEYLQFERASFSDRVVTGPYPDKHAEWTDRFKRFMSAHRAYVFHDRDQAQAEYAAGKTSLRKRARGTWIQPALTMAERQTREYELKRAYEKKMLKLEDALGTQERVNTDLELPSPKGRSAQEHEQDLTDAFAKQLSRDPKYFVDQTQQIVSLTLHQMMKRWTALETRQNP